MCEVGRILPAVPPRSRAEVEHEATMVTAATIPLLLKEPGAFPVAEFMEFTMFSQYGFRLGVSDNLAVEAVAYLTERLIMVSDKTYRDLQEDEPRARFTAAHELGHLILHADFVAMGEVAMMRKAEIKIYEDPEWQADVFATGLLVPAKVASGIPNLTEERLMEVFKVSRSCAKRRISELDKMNYIPQ